MSKDNQPKWGEDGIYKKRIFNPHMDWKHVDSEDLKCESLDIDESSKGILKKYQSEYSSRDLTELLQINADHKVWVERAKNKALPCQQRRALEIVDKLIFRVKRDINKLSPKTKIQLENVLRGVHWGQTPRSHTASGCEEWMDFSNWISALASAFFRIRNRTQTNKYKTLLALIYKLQYMLRSLDYETNGNLIITLARSSVECNFNENCEQGPVALAAFFYRVDRMHHAINFNIEECKRRGRPVNYDLRIMNNRLILIFKRNTGNEITHSSNYGYEYIQQGCPEGEPLSEFGCFIKDYLKIIKDYAAKHPSTISSLLAEHVSIQNNHAQAIG